MEKEMPLMEVRDTLGQRVDAAHFGGETTIITKNGNARAVLISYEDWREMRGALAKGE